MSKIEAMHNTAYELQKGYYEWNNQANALEFISLDPTNDHRDKRKKTHGYLPNLQGFQLKRLGGMTGKGGTIAGRSGVKSIGPLRRGSPKLPLQSAVVTLGDVKEVAMQYLASDYEHHNTQQSESFKKLAKKEQFNEFLNTLLCYFHCFFKHLEYEQKPQKSSYLHPSKAELQALAEAKDELEVTRRQLGQTYCILILGLGLEKQHHMGCGKKRVSSTHRDKKMFEDFYQFCTYVVWIAFKRKEFQRVKEEVGNMLRSSIFNPALQKKRVSDLQDSKKKQNIETKPKSSVKEDSRKLTATKSVGQRVQELLAVKLPEMERLTPAEHRRKNGKRPAIMKAIHQRSTALISLLPEPKEESKYLFSPFSSKEITKQSPNTLSTEEKSTLFLNQQTTLLQKVGIIGENKDAYTESLVPKSQENEDGEADSNEEDANVDGAGNSGRSSRQGMISRATTIAEN